jgi:hypothetical protein
VLRQSAQAAGFLLASAAGRHPVTLLDELPAERHLTSVVRLPPALATSVTDRVRTLPGGEQHYVYPATDLHLTVLNLDPVVDDEQLGAVATILRETPTFSIRLHGLALSQQSLSVRVYDASGALVALRRRLAAATPCQPSWRRRYLGFINVIRFRSPDVSVLAAAVKVARRTSFGVMTVERVDIVRTNKVLSVAGTTTVDSVALLRSD